MRARRSTNARSAHSHPRRHGARPAPVAAARVPAALALRQFRPAGEQRGDRAGPLQGWFDQPLWRQYSYAPFNARVLENYHSLAFFAAYDAPWNQYYRHPGVLHRLRLTLEYTFALAGPRGELPEYASAELDAPMLAPSSFGAEYLAAVLDQAGALLPDDLRARLAEVARRATRYVLTAEDSWEHARSFSNQFLGALVAARKSGAADRRRRAGPTRRARRGRRALRLQRRPWLPLRERWRGDVWLLLRLAAPPDSTRAGMAQPALDGSAAPPLRLDEPLDAARAGPRPDPAGRRAPHAHRRPRTDRRAHTVRADVAAWRRRGRFPLGRWSGRVTGRRGRRAPLPAPLPTDSGGARRLAAELARAS